MDDQLPPPGWFLRPESWPYWMPSALMPRMPLSSGRHRRHPGQGTASGIKTTSQGRLPVRHRPKTGGGNSLVNCRCLPIHNRWIHRHRNQGNCGIRDAAGPIWRRRAAVGVPRIRHRGYRRSLSVMIHSIGRRFVSGDQRAGGPPGKKM